MRTIRVTGKGNLKVHPDMTRIRITLEGRDIDYAETLQDSADSAEAIRDLLAPFSFERTDLKTLSFNVEPEYEHYEEKIGRRTEYKRRFLDYKFTNVMKVEFGSDNDRLGKILYALANCYLHPEFSLSYTVKDPEAAKNLRLDKAVKDAVAKAGVLAGAAGQKLGEIRNMDYSWGRIDFEYRPMDRDLGIGLAEPGCAVESCSLNLDIEPDDIEVEDTVTIVWEIL